MKIYLIQHGHSLSKEEDPKRSLSEKGKEDLKKVAKFLEGQGIKVKTLIHSKKERAIQTAHIISQDIEILQGPEEIDGLSPLDDPKIIFERIKDYEDDIMIVGHLPHLSKLASLILLGDESKELIRFQQGGVVCIEGDWSNGFKICWMVVPSIL